MDAVDILSEAVEEGPAVLAADGLVFILLAKGEHVVLLQKLEGKRFNKEDEYLSYHYVDISSIKASSHRV